MARLSTRATRRCARCAALFTPSRSDGRYCSARCRQAAFRSRVTAMNGSLGATSVAVTCAVASAPGRASSLVTRQERPPETRVKAQFRTGWVP